MLLLLPIAQASALSVAQGGKADEDALSLETLLTIEEEEVKDQGQGPALKDQGQGPALKLSTQGDEGDLVWNQAHIVSKAAVGTGVPSQRAVVSCSHDGSYVSVVYPFSKHYAVYRQGAVQWEE